MIDIHSHILPGVDDGARDFEDSIRIVRWLESQGATDVIATPHFMNETEYMSPRAENLELLKELQAKIDKAGIAVRLHLGNEIYIDREIERLIREGAISTAAEGEYILVELPLNDEYYGYQDYLSELVAAGYKVILAHPERYKIIQENYERIHEILQRGVVLQCNYRSILGKYGKPAERTVKRLAKDKLIFALASDIHRAGHGDYILKAQKKFAKFYNPREMTQLATLNPRRVIENR